jgi:succinylarginine dihydrolase
MNDFREVNFDGLVGPSHHYGGLSFGNLASMTHAANASDPQTAALQGLEKMWILSQRGHAQAVLPPLQRPNLSLLQSLGFRGSVGEMLAACGRDAPKMLSAVWSASNMWTANASTVIPSVDSQHRRLSFVPANLAQQFHRAQEATHTRDHLRAIFKDAAHFRVTDPLPCHTVLGDEGAANHTRFFAQPDQPGLHFFVYGDGSPDALKFPARQTELASRAVARLGGIDEAHCFFAQQSVEAINAGVFHNDVISVGQGDVLFYHEHAFENSDQVLQELSERFHRLTGGELRLVCVRDSQVSLSDAVGSYLFNSQLIDAGNGGKLLVVPIECAENTAVAAYLKSAVNDASNPIQEVLVQDLRQSMHNGGGPACLRLRVFMSAEERAAVSGRVFLDASLYHDLQAWIRRHYRTQLNFSDLSDPQLAAECEHAFRDLAEILELPSIFQPQHTS